MSGIGRGGVLSEEAWTLGPDEHALLVDELWVGRMDERGEDPHGPRRQDEGDPMASIRQALGTLRFWR